MNNAGPDADRLFDEAVELLIRLQNDPNNPVAAEMVRRWRLRGAEYEDAWAEAIEIHGMTGKILTDHREAEQLRKLPSRRTLMIGGFFAAGAVLTSSLTIPSLVLLANADHVTSAGETRHILLSDGSTAILGPDSSIALDLTRDARRIDLLKGMAFFEVASDPARPFSVSAGGVVATALGTAYDVSVDAGFVTVTVAHGTVGVQLPASATRPGPHLEAGDWVTFGQDDHSLVTGIREAGQIASWRDGLLVAEQERISAVVARIARWQPGQTVMASPALGNERISGVFDLRDPILALEAAVHPYGGKVRQVSPLLTVVSSF